jgi:hypothetical protein
MRQAHFKALTRTHQWTREILVEQLSQVVAVDGGGVVKQKWRRVLVGGTGPPRLGNRVRPPPFPPPTLLHFHLHYHEP